MARSTWVAHAFEWEKLLKCHMKGKASKKLANGQNIDYSEKRKRPKGFICPCTGVKYHNIQTCLLVYAADSGERLQDHWSSCFMKNLYMKFQNPNIHCSKVSNFTEKWKNQSKFQNSVFCQNLTESCQKLIRLSTHQPQPVYQI